MSTAFHPLKSRVRRNIVRKSKGHENDHALASMIVNARLGHSALGGWLGMSAGDFSRLMRKRFPGAKVPAGLRSGKKLPDARSLEWMELRQLLRRHQTRKDADARYFADILCSGCLGSDHLWQDLGLFERKELSQLMARNFPTLAQRNTKNMKWKKFLYKQLCIAEGIYVCRAPSCEECSEYDVCFSGDD